MFSVQRIHCPNCGSQAERYTLRDSNVTRTQCSACDYLMVTCALTGKVVEAYAPGLYADRQLYKPLSTITVLHQSEVPKVTVKV
jgi:hypothetical protein